MKLILSYSGALKGNRSTAVEKCELRAHFHRQLSNLWAVDPTLISWKTDGSYFLQNGERYQPSIPLKDCYARNFKVDNVHFVPLATKVLHLHCRIKILFLVAPNTSKFIAKGDIDNLTKTLLDGLRMPKQSTEIKAPIKNFDLENPLFVLMEDDDQVTELSVRYQTLLQFDPTDPQTNLVSAVIEVEVFPSPVTFDATAFL